MQIYLPSTNPSREGTFYATSHWFIACLVIFEYILKTKQKKSALNINPACWTCTVIISILYLHLLVYIKSMLLICAFWGGGGVREMQRGQNSRTGGAVSWCGLLFLFGGACKYYATAKTAQQDWGGWFVLLSVCCVFISFVMIFFLSCWVLFERGVHLFSQLHLNTAKLCQVHFFG